MITNKSHVNENKAHKTKVQQHDPEINWLFGNSRIFMAPMGHFCT